MIAFKIHRDIALEFRTLDPKTQGVFGLVLLSKFGYRYYFSAISVVALGLAIKAIQKKEDMQTCLLAMLLCVLSFGVYYIDIWKYLARTQQ